MKMKIFICCFCFLVQVDGLQPIHLAIVACGDRLDEALNALKSSLIFTPPPLIFHVFTENDLRLEFQEKIDSQWPLEYRSKFEMKFYSIEFPRGDDERWRNLFKPCCTQRLFLPDLLKNVDSVIYIDTDVLFLSNVRSLWRFFRKFNATQIAALSPEHEEPSMGWYNRFARHPYYGPMGLNSGVMLMNLTRMRQVQMISEIMNIFDQYHLNITWGDQCLLNIYFHDHPDQIFEFTCQWNYRPDHCIYENNCRMASNEGIRIVHGCRSAFHNEKYPEFRAISQSISQWNFDSNLKDSLLKTIQNRLKNYSSTNCGKSSDLFTKHLSREISSVDYSSKSQFHLAFLINDNWNSIDQTTNFLKSLRLFSSTEINHLTLHVVLSDGATRRYFSDHVERLVQSIHFYNTTIEHPLQLTTILNIDRVIYVNPNLIFLNSLDKFWSLFDQFNSKQIIGLFGQCHFSGFSNVLFLHLANAKNLRLNINGLTQLSTENVYFLPCKYLLDLENCQSLDEIFFLPEMADPSLFGSLYRTISQINSTIDNEFERNQFRRELIHLIKTHEKNKRIV